MACIQLQVENICAHFKLPVYPKLDMPLIDENLQNLVPSSLKENVEDKEFKLKSTPKLNEIGMFKLEQNQRFTELLAKRVVSTEQVVP
jgi:hypothetical protein